jgi:hypothetical protein
MGDSIVNMPKEGLGVGAGCDGELGRVGRVQVVVVKHALVV